MTNKSENKSKKVEVRAKKFEGITKVLAALAVITSGLAVSLALLVFLKSPSSKPNLSPTTPKHRFAPSGTNSLPSSPEAESTAPILPPATNPEAMRSRPSVVPEGQSQGVEPTPASVPPPATNPEALRSRPSTVPEGRSPEAEPSVPTLPPLTNPEALRLPSSEPTATTSPPVTTNNSNDGPLEDRD